MNVSWEDWTSAIAAGVRGVSDRQLAHAAAVLAGRPLVITAGNGGSASLASHAAQAFMKPGYEAGGGRRAICLNDAVPTLTAHANDGGWSSALLETARPFMETNALAFLLISSSGQSGNIVALAEEAKRRAHLIVSMTGFAGGPLRAIADVSIHVDSYDYEVVEPVHDALLHRIQYHLRGGK